MFQNDFKEFVYERLNNTVSQLRKNNENYKNKENEFEEIYQKLIKDLNQTQVDLLEELLNTRNYMVSDELVSLYVTAVKDTLQLNNDKFINNL